MKFRLFDNAQNELIMCASSEFQAVNKARKKGFKLVKIEPLNLISKHNLSQKEKIFLFYQFALLLGAGLSFVQICADLTHAFSSKNVQIFLKNLQSALQSGQSLSFAFSTLGFKSSEIALIKMGENTGNLSFVFEKLANIEEQNLKYQKQIKKALAYPAFVLLSLILAFCVMILFVIPQFEQIFTEFNATLPFITRFLLATYAFLKEFYFFIILIFLVLVLVFTLFYRHFRSFKFLVHTLFLKVPLVKNLIFYSQNSIFFEIFGLLFKSGVNVIDTLNLAKSSFNNLFLERKIRRVISLCQSGISLEEAFKRINIYDAFVLAMLKTAMKSSKLDVMSEKIASYFKSKQEDLNALFIAFLEPLMTLLVCILVLVLALGIFLPLWQLNEVINL